MKERGTFLEVKPFPSYAGKVKASYEVSLAVAFLAFGPALCGGKSPKGYIFFKGSKHGQARREGKGKLFKRLKAGRKG